MSAPAARPPKPPPAPDSVAHVSESHHLVRERRFDARTPLDDIARTLRESRATGTLTVDLAQGGVASVTFRERQGVHFDGPEREGG